MIKNEAILRDFLNLWSWQHQKRSNSARLPSIMESWLSAELTASFQCVLRIFQPMSLKYCACHGKVMPGHTKCCTCHTKSSSKTEDLMLQNAPFSGNQRPDLLTSLMNMSLVLRLPWKMHLSRSSSNVPRLPSFLDMLENHHVLLTFGKVQTRKTTSEPSKVVRACSVFHIVTWKCASRYNGEHGVPCAFWLPNVLRATTACTFSTSQLRKVVRTCGAFSFFTCKCSSRHNSVHFFISHLARLLRARRFSEPIFRPSEATNH